MSNFPFPVRPEPVEGLSFTLANRELEEVQCFDKLSTSGVVL